MTVSPHAALASTRLSAGAAGQPAPRPAVSPDGLDVSRASSPFQSVTHRQYPAAILTISDVTITPLVAQQGEDVFVEIEVTEETAPSSTFVAGWVIGFVGFSGTPLVHRCFLLEEGGTFTVSGSSIGGTMEPVFTMPDHDVDVEIFAGGYTADFPCEDVGIQGTQTDSATRQVQLASFDPRAVAIEGCGVPSGSPTTITTDETTQVAAQIRNGNTVPADVSVEFLTSAGIGLGSQSSQVPANTTETFSTAVSGGVLGVGSHTVIVNLVGATAAAPIASRAFQVHVGPDGRARPAASPRAALARTTIV